MFKKLIIGTSVLFLLTLSACNNQPGISMVRFEANGLARISKTPTQGMYALYERNVSVPDVTYKLGRDEPLGFVQSNGKVYAVAGTNKDELKPGTTYYWRQLDE